jgi:4,5-dihydroxyphthalate decarboxylase
MSAATWARGTLADEFGFDPFTAHWFIERLPEASIAAVSAARIPEGVQATQVPEGDSMRAMLRRGELDAVLFFVDELHPTQASPSDRSAADPSDGVTPLFDDAAGEGRRYLDHSGILPANHCIVVRASIAETAPAILNQLSEMFEAARLLASGETRSQLRLSWQMGNSDDRGWERFEFPPYEREDVSRTVQKLADHLYAQRLITKPVNCRELFIAD